MEKKYKIKISLKKAGISFIIFAVPVFAMDSEWGLFLGALLTGAFNALKFYYNIRDERFK